MLTAEDAVIKLTQPHGFGSKPKLTREREAPIRRNVENDADRLNYCWRSQQPHSSCKPEIVPVVDLFIPFDAEFYVAVVEKKGDFEAAVAQKRWLLSSSFASAARSFQVNIVIVFLYFYQNC